MCQGVSMGMRALKKSFFEKNKPSFCSGSCDEIHATTKLQNKTEKFLKHP